MSYLTDGPNENIQSVINAGVCRRLIELLDVRLDVEIGRKGAVWSAIASAAHGRTGCVGVFAQLPFRARVLVMRVECTRAFVVTFFASMVTATEDASPVVAVTQPWAAKTHGVTVLVAIATDKRAVLEVGELDDLVRELEQPCTWMSGVGIPVAADRPNTTKIAAWGRRDRSS